MKKYLLAITITAAAFAGKAQNLVPNPDFETFTSCPNGFSQIDLAIPWVNPSTMGSPDYYNQCSTVNFVDVPNNFWGYQPARSAVAYSGIYIWVNSTSTVREYIEIQLTSPLIANSCYHLEFYINLPNSCMYTSDAIGAYFSDTLITGIPNYDPLPFTAQIMNPTGSYPDTLNWNLVSGNYTAQGGERYLLIVNFNDSAATTVILINSSGTWNGAYFFIDDVSLTACTGIEENTNSAIKMYPNPVGDQLKIQNAEFKIEEVKIYDIMGKEILISAISNQQSEINMDVSKLKSAIYFVEVNAGKKIFRKKFLKE